MKPRSQNSRGWLSFGLIITLCAIIIGAVQSAHSEDPDDDPMSVDEPPIPPLCQRGLKDFQRLAQQTESHLVFENVGGLFNQGVCWWHSRFQRSAIYLAEFRPDFKKPTRAQAGLLADALIQMNRVVTIPGYATIEEFSQDQFLAIQDELEEWQLSAGLSSARFGLSGTASVPAAELEASMNALYQRVAKQNLIEWQMLQWPGIRTHSWLVIDMAKTGKGYKLDVIDSNNPASVMSYYYHRGETQVIYNTDTGTAFVPYMGYTEDLEKITRALDRYCGRTRQFHLGRTGL